MSVRTSDTSSRNCSAVAATTAHERLQSLVFQLHQSTGLPVLALDSITGGVRAKSTPELIAYCPAAMQLRLSQVGTLEVHAIGTDLLYFLLPDPMGTNGEVVLAGFARTGTQGIPYELVLASIEQQVPRVPFEHWVHSLPVCSSNVVEKLVESALHALKQQECETALRTELVQLQRDADRSAEEVNHLHELMQEANDCQTAEELAEHCLDTLQKLTTAAGHVLFFQDSDEESYFLMEGDFPLDETAVAKLLSRFDSTNVWERPLIRNRLQNTLLGADFPGLFNLAVLPVTIAPRQRRGWLLSCNIPDAGEFGPSEANLLATVQQIFATHLHRMELDHNHEELVISFVRSLVSTLDAKDPYTRGHSERVALIARTIGQQIGLPESDLDDIYLSGLLHDLGKIGIDDRVLRKPDQLTPEEFLHVQAHPMIGFQILQKLKTLQQILPGVRSHHESWNGKGYPDQLRGEDIPLMARILAVADSFDAMVSDRPYRKGMPIAQVEDIFRRGAGQQWDANLINAYFKVRTEIIAIGENYSPTEENLLSNRIARHLPGLTSRMVSHKA